MTSRRDFLKVGALAGAACATGGCSESASPSLKADVVVTLADYPELATSGGMVRIPSSESGYDFSLFVRNTGSEYVALSGWCDHEACDVRQSSSGFRCPCHGATFAADGTLTSGPATQSLIRFDTEATDTTLTILANA